MKYNFNFLKSAACLILATGFIACSDDNDNPDPGSEYSPYISEVFDFCPAAGQFTNALPAYKEGDTRESMIAKAKSAIAGSRTSMISLGGFGGYVVFGFDHTIENKSGLCDFRVKGNAFKSDANPKPGQGDGGSCEPGIILVSYDKNGNGLPDDEWYEIAGSAYKDSDKEYEIIYYKPDPDKEPVKGTLGWQVDVEYIKWTDNRGNTGYKTKNSYNGQSYFPEWITEDKITFKGTLLPENAVNEGTEKNPYWVLYAPEWGYVDNHPNNQNNSAIDIDWAVDKNGNKVTLAGIDFVKVYTGVNQEAGWLGEVSTEVAGAEDLHLLKIEILSGK